MNHKAKHRIIEVPEKIKGVIFPYFFNLDVRESREFNDAFIAIPANKHKGKKPTGA